MVGNLVSNSFFLGPDPVIIAQNLLGKVLLSNQNSILSGGIITETEAYFAPHDRASHAYGNKRTPRTEPMFGVGGSVYIYLCYGIHVMFNVVTGPIDTPHAVLIRAVEPTIGTDHMLDRRGIKLSSPIMFQGPGKVGQALGCTIEHSGSMMNQTDSIYTIHEPAAPSDFQIMVGPRVGIDYAGEWKDMPWRFRALVTSTLSK